MIARLRAYAGLWTLVGLLGLALVFVAAATGPVSRHSEDRALRAMVDQAPLRSRDLLSSEPVGFQGADESAAQVRSTLQGLLPPEIAGVVESSWGVQQSRVERPSESHPEQMVSLTGDGVSTEPSGMMPLVTLAHQTDLATEVRMLEGSLPQTEPAEHLGATEIAVMVSERVAAELGVRAGEVYYLLLGVAKEAPYPPAEADGPVVAIRVTGVFQPREPDGPAWQLDQRLLRTTDRPWPDSAGLTIPLRQGTLVTDQTGIDTLLDLGLNRYLGIENQGRVRLDPQQLDAAWVDPAREAVGAVLTSPARRPDLRVATGLIDLLDEFERQAAAARAVTAVVAAGLVGTGLGLLLLAARVTVDRRGAELSLLRARGGSVPSVVGRFLREAVLVLVPAAAAGWLLHRLLPGRPDPPLVLGIGAAPLVVAAVTLLAVPVTVAFARSGGGRRDLTRHRSAPARLTVELLVLLLAALGVLLLHERGLTSAPAGGTDPFLSAVPVLIGAAAGLLALRVHPWPLRALGALTRRRRGAVGFLGLARAGRAAPAAALPLLVLVLAIAAGGFAGAVYASVNAARDAATLRAVGADLRVAAADLPDGTVATVAAVPGVDTVAAVSEDGYVQIDGNVIQNVTVLAVDTAAYQEVLAAVGAPGRLPDRVASARPGGPLPVLGPAPDPGESLTVTIADIEYPADVVSDVAGLPELTSDTWVLVPRQALPEPPLADQLLIAGPDADPAAVGAAVGGDPAEVTITTQAAQRAELERSGFNQTLSLVFTIGTAGAVAGGLLAIGLALAMQAGARGRALSLLRTMGLSAGQARGLLLVELVPVAALAVAVGAATGTVMPVLLAPALGLTEFTGGAPLPVALNPATVGVLAGLLAVFLVGGLLAESAINRRLGLGQVLRVESALR